MKNILFINGNLNVGGVEMALVNLLNGLDSSKYNIDLLLLQDGYTYEKSLPGYVNCIKVKIDEEQGPLLEAIVNGIKKKNWTSVSFRLMNVLSSRISPWFHRFIYLGKKLKPKYDCVVAFRPGICADLALYKINSARKVCWWHHGEINGESNILVRQLSRFNKVIAVSRGIKSLLQDTFPRLKSKIEILPNCIDIGSINLKTLEFNPYQESKTDGHLLRIVTVSRLSPEKNVAMATEVAKRLKARNIEFEWHIIGDGECMLAIQDEIHNNGLESYIYLEGNQTNPYPWIAGADLMVHLSPVESFGLVILEAMSIGTPCIAVESIGAKELLNGNNGILTPLNADILAEEIANLSMDEYRRKSIVQNAKATAAAYSSNTISTQFEEKVHSIHQE